MSTSPVTVWHRNAADAEHLSDPHVLQDRGSPACRTPSIRLAGEDGEFPCCSGQTVLGALSSVYFRKISSGCHGGGCGVCRAQLVSGEIRTAPMSRVHVPKEDEARGVFLACRAWPVTDVTIAPLGKLIGKRGGMRAPDTHSMNHDS